MQITKYLPAFVVSFGLVLLTRSASAQEKAAEKTVLGKRGTIVLYRVVGLSSVGGGSLFQAGILTFSHTRQKFYWTETTTTTVGIRPSLDVFVSHRVTLGGDLGFGYTWMSSSPELGTITGIGQTVPYSGFTVKAAPRIGYYVPIGDTVAIWPRAALGIDAGYRTTDVRAPGVEADEVNLRLHAALDVDLVVPITPHLTFLVGPRAVGTLAGARARETASVEVSAKGSLSLAF